MALTQKELAQRLNISQVTVSRALRGSKGVSEKLRRRIRQEADRAGYSIQATNHEARTMRRRACGHTQVTNVVCVLVDLENDPGEHSFNGRIFHGICTAAEELGVETVLTGRVNGDLPLLVHRGQVDGLVCLLNDIQVSKGHEPVPVPCVSILYHLPGADVVAIDNVAGAREVGRFICEQGHKTMAFIGPESELARERLSGLRRAADEAGAEVPDELVYLRPYVSNRESTRELVEQIFRCREGKGGPVPFTALVAYNDYMAAVTAQRLQEAGWRIPEELSIAGFDGVWPGTPGVPRITTAAIPLEDLGAEATRLLCWRLRNPDGTRRQVMLETQFVEGGTVGPCPTSPPLRGEQ